MLSKSLISLAALALLVACAAREAPAPEPVVVEAEADLQLKSSIVCLPDEDDGIGGTGCQLE